MNFNRKSFEEIVRSITKSESKAAQAMDALKARGGDYWAARNVVSDDRIFTELQTRKGLELLYERHPVGNIDETASPASPVAPTIVIPEVATTPTIVRKSVMDIFPTEEVEETRPQLGHWSHSKWAVVVFVAISGVIGLFIGLFAIKLVDTRWGWLTTILSGMVGIGIVLAITGVAMLGLQAIRRRHNYPYEPVRGSNAPEEV